MQCKVCRCEGSRREPLRKEWRRNLEQKRGGRVLSHAKRCANAHRCDGGTNWWTARRTASSVASGLRRAHPSCPQLWAASIAFELRDDPPPVGDAVSAVGGGERRARSLYEAALRPEACGACAGLWRDYLGLEVSAGRREAACRALLRAVQLCPGAKALWIDALRPPLLGWMSDQQLQDMVQLVGEKELRLRHDLPEPDELQQAIVQERAEAARLEAARASQPAAPPPAPPGGVPSAADGADDEEESSSDSSEEGDQ